MSSSGASRIHSGALQCGARGGFLSRGTLRGAERPASSPQLARQQLKGPGRGQERPQPSPPPLSDTPQQGRHTGRSTAVGAAGRAGWVLPLCRLSRGAVASARQKATSSPNSAPATTDAAAQPELSREHAAAPLPGRRLCPALAPAAAGCGEHACGKEVRPGRGAPPLSGRALGGVPGSLRRPAGGTAPYHPWDRPAGQTARHSTRDAEDSLSSLTAPPSQVPRSNR